MRDFASGRQKGSWKTFPARNEKQEAVEREEFEDKEKLKCLHRVDQLAVELASF
jgi:hypothetical protein